MTRRYIFGRSGARTPSGNQMNINTSAGSLKDQITETVGIKTGLVVTHAEMVDLMERSLRGTLYNWYYLPKEWLHADTSVWVRLRPDDLESLVTRLMYLCGAIQTPLTSDQLLFKFLKDHPTIVTEMPPHEEEELFPPPMRRGLRFQWWTAQWISSGGGPEILRDVLTDVERRSIFKLFFSRPQTWDGRAHLRDLFDMPNLGGEAVSGPGTAPLIDQLFIDYLHAQQEDIARMHWRQFELLVGEWFRRSGYSVVVTLPSGDGGIDIRASRDDGIVGPELVVAQAKRYRVDRTVDIDSVKAFWTDIDEVGATRGVVATTSSLAKGARKFCEARPYRLTVAENATVREWLAELASNPRERSAQ